MRSVPPWQTIFGGHAPWDDPEYTDVGLEDLGSGRIVPGDVAALQNVVKFIARELYWVHNEVMSK